MRKKILLSIVLIVIIVVIAVGAVDSGVMNKLEHLGRMVPEVLNSDDVLATYKERNVTAGMVTLLMAPFTQKNRQKKKWWIESFGR